MSLVSLGHTSAVFCWIQPNFKLPGQKHVFTQSCITDRSRLHVVYCVCLCACHDDIVVYKVVVPCNLSYLSVSWLVGMFAKSCLWRCCEASWTISYPRCPIIFHHKCVNVCLFLHVLAWFHCISGRWSDETERADMFCVWVWCVSLLWLTNCEIVNKKGSSGRM